MKILFLDYDGVVNTPMWDEKGERCSYNFPFHNKVNNYQAVQWISEFCQKFGFSIVVTSTWRIDDNYKECLINGGLRDGVEILGRTDDLYRSGEKHSRGEEIQKWLNEHPECEYYLIVDDDSDILPEQKNNFVKTDTLIGFTMREYTYCQVKYEEYKTKHC